MDKWYQTFHKGTGLSPYIWLVFCILPFYFIFGLSSTVEVVSGTILIIAFFVFYLLAFLSKGWPIYVWTSAQLIISMIMTVVFSRSEERRVGQECGCEWLPQCESKRE